MNVAAPARPSPLVAEPYFVRRREAAYRHFVRMCRTEGAQRVLDACSLDGYGAAIAASSGLDVLAVEQSRDAAVAAARAYRLESLRFRVADPARLDEESAAFDAIICAGALETRAEPRPLVSEVRRLVRPGGFALFVTVNRLTASPGRSTPIAGTHAVEYTPEELFRLLTRRFTHVSLLGVFHRRRLELTERVLGSSIPERLLTVPPVDRPFWVGSAMARLRASSFAVAGIDLRTSGLLLGVARP